MATEKPEVSTCEYCKEEVKPDAIKCKHCGSRLKPAKLEHGGICPFCKEQIHVDAIKCKHCKSNLGGVGDGQPDCGGCGQSGADDPDEMSIMAMRRPAFGGSGFGGSGGIVSDPGHDCWAACVDAYVDCRTTTTNRRSAYYCQQRFRWCQMLCPQSGPQIL